MKAPALPLSSRPKKSIPSRKVFPETDRDPPAPLKEPPSHSLGCIFSTLFCPHPFSFSPQPRSFRNFGGGKNTGDIIKYDYLPPEPAPVSPSQPGFLSRKSKKLLQQNKKSFRPGASNFDAIKTERINLRPGDDLFFVFR